MDLFVSGMLWMYGAAVWSEAQRQAHLRKAVPRYTFGETVVRVWCTWHVVQRCMQEAVIFSCGGTLPAHGEGQDIDWE